MNLILKISSKKLIVLSKTKTYRILFQQLISMKHLTLSRIGTFANYRTTEAYINLYIRNKSKILLKLKKKLKNSTIVSFTRIF